MTIDWSLSGPNPLNGDNSLHQCNYTSVLRLRKPKKEGDAPTKTLFFSKPNDLTNMDHEACQTILSNLTNLDQPLVRDQIAKIISDFPCPDANIKIKSFQAKNAAIKAVFPNARTNRSLKSVVVDGCLKERLDECIIPMGQDPDFIMTFEDLKQGMELCSEAMKAAVKKGAELAAWQKQNDPNKSKTATTEQHTE
jgi:hypothetical protein